MDAIHSLCQQGYLHFYKAWTVVAKHVPELPADEVAAASWLRLLGAAAQGAEEEPEKAVAAVQLLQEAAAHRSAKVSGGWVAVD